MSRLAGVPQRLAIWLFSKLPGKQFLIVSAMIVGLWAGLTAVFLKVSVHYLQSVLTSFAANESWITIISPAIGIFSSWLFIRFFLGGELVKGTSHVLLAIAQKSSMLPRQEIYSHAATSALTVGLGGSAGLESPIVQTGSAIGSTFASIFPVGYRERTLLLACGAAAGIATAFNAPIAGVLFSLEVLLVDVNVSTFIPLLISGAVGALCSKVVLSEGILLSFRQIRDFDYHNIPYYIVLGVLAGLLSSFYLKSFVGSENLFKDKLKSGPARLIVGCFMLGVLMFLFPALFGEGYGFIKALANGQPNQLFASGPFKNIVQNVWIMGGTVLLLGLVKVFAVMLTINSGGNGGNFAPSLLVGACLGFSFAWLLNATGLVSLPIANFCLVAMAGLLTGIFHAPLTAVFLIAEITGGYDLIIPLMIVSALSTAVSKYLSPHSLDEVKLIKSESVKPGKDMRILSEMSLQGFIEKDFHEIRLGSTLRTLVNGIVHSKRNIFPVVNDEGKLEGIIALEDIREIMFNSSQYDSIKVDQLMRKPQVTVNLSDDMKLVMEKFDKSGVWNMPVLDDGTYIGCISKSRVFSSYRDRLILD